MKTLSNVKASVKDGKLTLTADIVEKQFTPFLIQRVTIGHLNPKNIRHPRHVQISNEAIFVKAFGNAFAMEIDDIVAIACAVEPKTSFAPLFHSQPKSENLTAEVCSELDPDFQWQVSDKIDSTVNWSNIEGQTTKALDKSKVKANQWVRLIAHSESGSMASNPVQIT